ncbi:MAG: acyl-CoA mutase large subunit family protein [Alistipes sp.]|jgi:methylmalonyl-CoA mutase|nr:acyl-CoA mutase large subunit family protein [Alistipes sp.]
MADNKKERLFAQFPPVSTEQWEAVIAADLKGADYEKKLVWRTAEGINVRPYYRAEDLAKVPFAGSEPGCFPFVRGTRKSGGWRVHQTIAVKCAASANEQALAALNAGCDSLGFCLGGELSAADMETLLKGIVLSAIDLVFCGKGTRAAAETMLARLEAEKADPTQVRISFAIDPVVTKLSLEGEFGCGGSGDNCFAKIADLAKRYEKYPKVRVVTVGGDKFNASGSTIVQELAFTLAVGHEYLVRLMENGLSADRAAEVLRFSMAVSSNYFMEIAKFRAARMLWANIVNQYGPASDCPAKMFTHAVTSKWNQTAYDPHTNMLRGTTEAMSAAIAGVDSLEVTPFDAAFETPTDFSRRIARNVQLLLKHESHFDQVVDPSGGSYYIETLTNNIADEAWKLFRQVEEKGGYVAAFKAGFITAAVEASAAAKDKAVATRRTILLGANQYPNFTETAGENLTAKAVRPAGCDPDCKCAEGGECTCAPDCDCKNGGVCTCGKTVLRPYRGSMPFERIRLATDKSGKTPTAFMLTCGTLAMARARAQFACNFFACAGIRVVDNTFFASVDEGVKAALAAKADIVVICASDDDYTALAPEAHKLLGGKAILVVAGAPASQPELEAAGISHFISVKSNVLETLKSYLKELGI